MLSGLFVLLAAVIAFVGCHLVLSHALRAPAISALGLNGFHLVYGTLSLTLLLLTLVAYHQAPHAPVLWSSDNLATQIIFAIGSWFGLALFVASLVGNPGLVGANIADLSTRRPTGVYLVTRHPMMFAIAILSAMRLLIDPTLRDVILFSGLIVLALAGSYLQDGKKIALSGREWAMWVNRTPFWPNLRRMGELGMAWPLGLLPWLLITWIVMRATFIPIGLWYFFPSLRNVS